MRASDDPTMGPHDINWGSHGCMLATVHAPAAECECNCCECPPGQPCRDSCMAKPPHYGPDTHYYGADNSAADEAWFNGAFGEGA